MHFSIFYAILVYCKRELLFKQKPSYPTVDLSLDFVVLVSYLKCFAFGYITINAFWGHSAELYLERIVTKIFKTQTKTQLILIRDGKYKRDNNQLKFRNGLQMNHFKNSSLSLECANSCEVILLWFCSDDHEKWLSADNNLQEHQTKFNDKNI